VGVNVVHLGVGAQVTRSGSPWLLMVKSDFAPNDRRYWRMSSLVASVVAAKKRMLCSRFPDFERLEDCVLQFQANG